MICPHVQATLRQYLILRLSFEAYTYFLKTSVVISKQKALYN